MTCLCQFQQPVLRGADPGRRRVVTVHDAFNVLADTVDSAVDHEASVIDAKKVTGCSRVDYASVQANFDQGGGRNLGVLETEGIDEEGLGTIRFDDFCGQVVVDVFVPAGQVEEPVCCSKFDTSLSFIGRDFVED